jgi:hypothetical protein
MKHVCCLALAVALSVLRYVGALAAADVKTELDCAVNVRVLDTHFGRYGYEPKTCIIKQPKGVRFWLPAQEGVGQTGLYSFVALAGDFEVSALYDLDEVAEPEAGYGPSCGIAVDALDSSVTVSLARAHLRGKGQGPSYLVSRGTPAEKGMRYESTDYRTTAKSGKLVLRRERDEVVCLAADGIQAPLRELCRLPFSFGTVRPVRLFADTGGSPTGLDARLTHIRLSADEIAAGLVRHEQSSNAGGWLTAGAVVCLLAVFLLIRKKQEKWPFAEAD